MHLIPPNPNLRLHHPMDCAILGLVLHHGHLPIQLLLQLPLLSPGPLPDIVVASGSYHFNCHSIKSLLLPRHRDLLLELNGLVHLDPHEPAMRHLS